jgi:hypothetical protein
MSSSTPTTQSCPACDGTGVAQTVNGQMTCGLCGGAGQVESSETRQPFGYVFNPNQQSQTGSSISVPGTVTANGTALAVKQIDPSSDFEWVFTVANFTSNQLLVYLRDDTINFTSDPVLLNLFAGTAQQPFPVWVGGQPYVFGARSVLEFTLTDQSGSNNTGQIVLWGFKILKRSQGANSTAATQPASS